MATAPSALSLASQITSGQQTASESCARCLQHINRVNPTLNAFLETFSEEATVRANSLDRERAGGPLAGVPVAIKDNICTRTGHTTCASRMLADFRSPYNATVINRLLNAGAILVGKTNLDEFAMGSSNEYSARGPVPNPWDLDRVAGGSSGGSAAAVAAGLVPLALGSDTGGSIRLPAAFCGVVGLKPSYGRVSRHGLVAFGSSLEQIGPVANNVTDAALLLGVVAGRDPHETTSVDLPVPDYVAELHDDRLNRLASRLRIGMPREYLKLGLDEQTRRTVLSAADQFRRLGATVKEVSLPHVGFSVPAYYLIAAAEASSNLARYDGVRFGYRAAEATNIMDLCSRSRSASFGPEVKRRIMLGTYALSAGYARRRYDQALCVRRLIRQDFDAALSVCDVLLGPTTPTPAFRLGEKVADPVEMYLADVYTAAVNLAGLPAISIPGGLSQARLPIGLQLIGPMFGELVLLQAARLYERETDWHS